MPERMHDAERAVAFGDAAHQNPRRTDVHELIEGELLGLHFAPDAVDVLGPAVNRGLDARRLELGLQMGLQLLDVSLALRAPGLQRSRDVLVMRRLEVPEGQILQLPFDLPDTEPVGEWRVDLAGFHGKSALAHGIQRLGGAHLLQLLGEPHHDQAHIANHRKQHLAQCLRLPRLETAFRGPIRRQAEAAQVAQAAGQPDGLRAESCDGALVADAIGVEEGLQRRCHDDVVVGIEAAHDLGHFERAVACRIRGGRQIERAHRHEPLLELAAGRAARSWWFP